MINDTYTKTVDLSAVDPNPDNYNTHTADQLADLQDSLRQFGYVRRIVVKEQTNGRFLLVAGEGVFTAAKLEGFADLEMTVIPHDWPIEKVNAYLVADNLHAQASTPDESKLLKLVQAARDYDVSLAAATGVSDERYQALVRQAAKSVPQTDPEDAQPETPPADQLQAKWNAKEGDIWRVGNHFVACGDCREPETWARLYAAVGIEAVHGIFTSPPYAEQRKQQYGGTPSGEYVEWWESVQGLAKGGLAADGSFFVNLKPHVEDGGRTLYVGDLVAAMVRRWGWIWIDEFCWITKSAPGEWPNRFKNWFEPVYHFSPSPACKFRPENVIQEFTADADKMQHYSNNYVSGGGFRGHAVKSHKYDGALPSNVLEIANRDTEAQTLHNAVFPVALPEFFIKAFSDEGDCWLDPFAGSGSTLIAAHKNGRIGLGIELLPKYVSVIIERLLLATGEPPMLIEDCQ